MATNKISRFFTHPITERVFLTTILLTAAIAFGTNLFNFPYFENDEGTYYSQAWSLYTNGQLAPYTYWYDHAPFGWIQIGLWSVLTGGFSNFGFSLNSGRIFMLTIQVLNTFLIYIITKRLTNSKMFSGIAAIMFALSPLGIFLQRRILLDNLASLWLLVSTYILLRYENNLFTLVLSGITFGFAVLSKESAIVFGPAMLYFTATIAHRHHRIHATVLWATAVGSLVCIYFSYALFKGELFPPYILPWDQQPHVSLLGTLLFQSQRGGGSITDLTESDFWLHFRNTWALNDPLLLYAGIIALCSNLILGIRNLHARILSIATLCYLAFLSRGGIVLDFYIIPLLPFLVFNLIYLIWITQQYLLELFRKSPLQVAFRVAPAIACIIPILQFINLKDAIGIEKFSLYNSNQTKPQLEAIEWIKTNLYPEDVILFDNYAHLELKAAPDQNIFPYSEWYIKVDTDNQVRDRINGDYTNIDYLAITPQIENDIKNFSTGLPIVEQAYNNAQEIHTFYNDRWSVKIMGLMTPQRITTSGYRSLMKKFTNQGMLTWHRQEYKHYILLLKIAIAKDQRSDFDHILSNYTTIHNANPKFNLDTAQILLLASQKWSDETLTQSALTYIEKVKNSLIEWEGYTLPFSKTASTNAVISLIDLNVATYEQFLRTTQDDIWRKVKNDSYRIIDFCMQETRSQLPASTCDLEQYSDDPLTAKFYYPVFDTNSAQIFDHISHDLVWFESPQAKVFLNLYPFLHQEWMHSYHLSEMYRTDTSSLSGSESIPTYQAIFPVIQYINPEKAQELYDLEFKNQFKQDQIQTWWGTDPDNLDTILHSMYTTLYFEGLL